MTTEERWAYARLAAYYRERGLHGLADYYAAKANA